MSWAAYTAVAILTFVIIIIALHLYDNDVLYEDALTVAILLVGFLAAFWPMFWGFAALWGVLHMFVRWIQKMTDKYIRPVIRMPENTSWKKEYEQMTNQEIKK